MLKSVVHVLSCSGYHDVHYDLFHAWGGIENDG
jgi:hypothetical protein